jgi:hypothetical protein
MSQPTAIDNVPAAPTPTRIGQGTAVEQSRAVAEVQGAIIVAQQCPRRMDIARTAMRESCEQLSFAEQAFFSFPRAGSTVSGPSIHLAKELARCFGNVQYGINELRRDDEFGQSEMLAWAWDVQMNTRASNTFINPHMRDKRGGPQKLTELRDIYENNANMGNRRLRQAIFSILPAWFREEAEEICRKTLSRGDGKPLPERIDAAVKVYKALGVSAERLEQKLGRDRADWTPYDVTQLRITHRSIERGEIAIDEAFPQPRVTAEEITQQASETPAAQPPTQPPPANSGQDVQRAATVRTATQKQLTEINTLLGSKCDARGDDRLTVLAEPELLGRAIGSSKEITFDEARQLIETLAAMPDYTPPANDGPGTEPM